jgi:hypothetical protein
MCDERAEMFGTLFYPFSSFQVRLDWQELSVCYSDLNCLTLSLFVPSKISCLAPLTSPCQTTKNKSSEKHDLEFLIKKKCVDIWVKTSKFVGDMMVL